MTHKLLFVPAQIGHGSPCLQHPVKQQQHEWQHEHQEQQHHQHEQHGL
jgi:hypothetical protein